MIGNGKWEMGNGKLEMGSRKDGAYPLDNEDANGYRNYISGWLRSFYFDRRISDLQSGASPDRRWLSEEK